MFSSGSRYEAQPLGRVNVLYDGRSIGVIIPEQGAGAIQVYKAELLFKETVPKFIPETRSTQNILISRPITVGWFSTFKESLDVLIEHHREIGCAGDALAERLEFMNSL